MFKRLLRKLRPNPLDSLLLKAKHKHHKTFLLAWNRGLGDIALGLYAIVHRIREYVPEAKITFVTREDLEEGFFLLDGVDVVVAPKWKRKEPISLLDTMKERGEDLSSYDVVIEAPDPTYWVKWQLGSLVPKLKWNPKLDALADGFSLSKEVAYVGVHVQTETSYGYEKNWPLSYWEELFTTLYEKHGLSVILFGMKPTHNFSCKAVVDLRGKTNLHQMLSLIKNRCRYLIVPDSGVLSLTYFIDEAFPLKIISLWADPRQGVLKQNVPSPNPYLVHIPLKAHNEDIRTISVQEVEQALTQG